MVHPTPQTFGSPRRNNQALRHVNTAWAILGLVLLLLVIAVLAFAARGRTPERFDAPVQAPMVDGNPVAPLEHTPANPPAH